ncbi:MAG: type VI secretion system tube protein TssD [Oculatellaceae cyanobacterium bins.114]|nr:type VI secretion system tube protein TssD [Oculatellaceae cyanobacterium bins.114]
MTREFYVSIEGTVQGKFKGEAEQETYPDKLVGLHFTYEVQSPRDRTSGMATGKRQHSPIVITKAWGSATPQLFQALISNEVLRTVFIEFVRPNSVGETEVYHIVKLTNAMISHIRQYTGSLDDEHSTCDLEDITLMFQRIEMQNLPSKIIAIDEWLRE